MAGNLTQKTDLLKLKGAVIMPIGKNNTECIVIPIEMASLYKGTAAVYLDTTAIPLANPKQGSKDTHIVKQAFSKEKFAAMTEDEKKALPILGNLIDWDKVNGTSAQANNTPAASTTPPSWL